MRIIVYICLGLALFQFFPLLQYAGARPMSQTNGTESRLPKHLQARLSETISEIEWLLHQLVNILTDMVTGAEQDPTLLNNHHFRKILIQVIKRIDIILEHFEYVGPTVLTEVVQNELQRINCVRIRLANYISQSQKYDVSICMPPKPHGSESSQQDSSKNPMSNDQMMPLLTQIVSLLVQILNQLNTISANGAHHEHHNHHHNSTVPASVGSTPMPAWSNSANSINWDDLMSQFVSSQPVTQSSAQTTTINWDNIFGSTAASAMGNSGTSGNQQQSTQNWNDLISQVMGSMGNTLSTSAPTSTTSMLMSQSSTMAWEDAMNDLIGQWNQAANQSPSNQGSNPMSVQQCVDSILSLINTIQSQLPTAIPSESLNRNYYDINGDNAGANSDTNTDQQQLERAK